MFVQFNQCDCFIPNLSITDITTLMQFLFYSVMVSKSMSNDTSIIRAFSVACVDHKLGVENDIHLLVLENSNKLVSHAASDPASSIFVSTMVDNLSSFKAWKLFDDKTSMERFTAELKKVDVVGDGTPTSVVVIDADEDSVAQGKTSTLAVAQAKPSTVAAAVGQNAGNGNCNVDFDLNGNQLQQDKNNSDAMDDKQCGKYVVDVATDGHPSNAPVAHPPPVEAPVPAYKCPNPVDGLDTFDCSKLSFTFDKEGKQNSQPRGCEFSLSALFPHKIHPYGIMVGMLKKINTNVWHIDSRYWELRFKPFVDKLESEGREVPLFMTTCRDMGICDQGNPAKYRRRGAGYVVRNMFFLMRVPNGFAPQDIINQTINAFSSPFKESVKDCGMQYANWLREIKVGAYNNVTGETGKNKKISHDELAKQMQVKLVNGFSKHTNEYNVPLNKWITYWDIKSIMTEHLGYSNWSDVPPNMKKYVISQSPRVDYPDWDSIAKDEY